MTQQKPRTKLTVGDYMNTPDEVRYQLIDGELVLAPSPNDKHQVVSLQLATALNQFVRQFRLGSVRCAPFDVVFPDHEVFQPDILFVSNERRDIITEANIQGAPDLVVEILSPSTARYDRGHKQDIYAREGVREYWIVNPATETVEVLTARNGVWRLVATFGFDDKLVSSLLPGLSVDLREVFAAT
jgi:Uma2 family endonuclease